jgi:DNA invertase Pin-like site-specific DNA recombinase
MKSNICQDIAAYARVSTLLGQDPEIQLSQIRTFASARGFNLAQTYVDQGVSGSKDRRPALDQLVKDARNGKFSLLVIVAIDRLARDTRHLLNLICELNHYGIAVISLRENIDFSTPMGQATLTIIGAVAQLERELIRERIRNALAAKKLAAEKTGSGWRCGRKPVITPEVTEKVLQLRQQGVSVRQIAKQVGIAKSSVQRVLKSVPSNLKKTSGVSS